MSIFRKRAEMYQLSVLQRPGRPRMATRWSWLKRLVHRTRRIRFVRQAS